MKKIIVFLLTFILIFTFSACGKNEDNEKYLVGVELLKETLETEPMSAWQARCFLEIGGYSTEEINTILKASNIDWNKQALKACEYELDEGPISKEGLINYLTLLKFSKAEIQYGLNNLDVVWHDQCLYAAMNYVSMGFTDELTIASQLVNDGFTQPEIDYAIALIYPKEK